MLVVVSKRIHRNRRIYHRPECIYAKRIKGKYRKELSIDAAEKRHYHECKYCSGLRGDARAHKEAFDIWAAKNHMQFVYRKENDTLYIQTEIGFWKIFRKEKLGKYFLYHRNTYTPDMTFEEAIRGDFHKQKDVKTTSSIDKLVEYVIAHDKAKLIIMDDYRKLPKSSKIQKQYYNAAKKKERRNAIRRVNAIFESLEQSHAGLIRYSVY